ncbi:MAG: hydrogenase maturation nickel metallochaperone HypA [Lachnospiraceae bacterium]|nr:hydrogenase maturation nickel metallochaperone HypA [Lachnospiraceae bacterium]
MLDFKFDKDKAYEGRCGNCHAFLKDGAKYCSICGTKAGDGAYEPFEDIMQCIYGPMPEERTHVCEDCGYTWTTMAMIDNEEFCPECGGKAPVVLEGKRDE